MRQSSALPVTRVCRSRPEAGTERRERDQCSSRDLRLRLVKRQLACPAPMRSRQRGRARAAPPGRGVRTGRHRRGPRGGRGGDSRRALLPLPRRQRETCGTIVRASRRSFPPARSLQAPPQPPRASQLHRSPTRRPHACRAVVYAVALSGRSAVPARRPMPISSPSTAADATSPAAMPRAATEGSRRRAPRSGDVDGGTIQGALTTERNRRE